MRGVAVKRKTRGSAASTCVTAMNGGMEIARPENSLSSTIT